MVNIGKCLLDLVDKSKNQVPIFFKHDLSNNHVLLSQQTFDGEEAITLEHSPYCRSREHRKRTGEKNVLEVRDESLQVATCAFLLDQSNSVLLTKRPAHMNIYPDCWVLPGGRLDEGETLDQAIDREVNEELGIQVQELYMEKKKYFLYESVTKNISGYDTKDEVFPPKRSHLILFYLYRLKVNHLDIKYNFQKDEVEEIVSLKWEHLKQVCQSDWKSRVTENAEGVNLEGEKVAVSLKKLFPPYRINPYKQGIGQGHYIALRYLLKKYF